MQDSRQQNSYVDAAQSAIEQLRPHSKFCCRTVTFRQHILLQNVLQNSSIQAAQSAVELTSRQHSLLQNSYVKAAQSAVEQLRVRPGSKVYCRTVTSRGSTGCCRINASRFQGQHCRIETSRGSTGCCRIEQTHPGVAQDAGERHTGEAQNATEQTRPGVAQDSTEQTRPGQHRMLRTDTSRCSTGCYRTVTFRQHSLLQNLYVLAVEQLLPGSTVCCSTDTSRGSIKCCRIDIDIDTSGGSTGCYRTDRPGAALHAACRTVTSVISNRNFVRRTP